MIIDVHAHRVSRTTFAAVKSAAREFPSVTMQEGDGGYRFAFTGGAQVPGRQSRAARVMLGSDYPFPIGDPGPCKIVHACGFNEADLRSILGGNAARLFQVSGCGCGS